MLLKEYLKRENIQQKELANILNIDKVQMNEIANYKVLPLPEQADKICECLNCNILDIYNKNEIDLVKGVKKASRNKTDNLYYRLSVRLNKSGCNCLKLENLQILGYKTIKEWVLECMDNLKERQRQAKKGLGNENLEK